MAVEHQPEVPEWIVNHPELVADEVWLYSIYSYYADDTGRIAPFTPDETQYAADLAGGTPDDIREWTLSLIEAGALLVNDDGSFTLADSEVA